MQYAESFNEESAARLAINNFAALLDDTDFIVELGMMGVGRMQFMLRRRMLVEWRGLYMALWRLALSQSFPDEADDIFTTFLTEFHKDHQDKLTVQSLVRAREYWAMLEPCAAGADFSSVAHHLTSFFSQDSMQSRSMSLKLALHIRNVYRLIFERLF